MEKSTKEINQGFNESQMSRSVNNSKSDQTICVAQNLYSEKREIEEARGKVFDPISGIYEIKQAENEKDTFSRAENHREGISFNNDLKAQTENVNFKMPWSLKSGCLGVLRIEWEVSAFASAIIVVVSTIVSQMVSLILGGIVYCVGLLVFMGLFPKMLQRKIDVMVEKLHNRRAVETGNRPVSRICKVYSVIKNNKSQNSDKVKKMVKNVKKCLSRADLFGIGNDMVIDCESEIIYCISEIEKNILLLYNLRTSEEAGKVIVENCKIIIEKLKIRDAIRAQ